VVGGLNADPADGGWVAWRGVVVHPTVSATTQAPAARDFQCMLSAQPGDSLLRTGLKLPRPTRTPVLTRRVPASLGDCDRFEPGGRGRV
jgi:hypothetical protein